MSEKRRIAPYQPGDLAPDILTLFGTSLYTGPVFRLHYPANCDPTNETMWWGVRGYDCSGESQTGEDCVVTVNGRIPEWLLDRLKEAKVRVELFQARAKRICSPSSKK